jgi:hypothetical protein
MKLSKAFEGVGYVKRRWLHISLHGVTVCGLMDAKKCVYTPDLRPVKLHLIRGHALHPPAEVMRNADVIRICLEVVHRYRYAEIRREKQP